jgi:polyisoprenoid-binding protein YceI
MQRIASNNLVCLSLFVAGFALAAPARADVETFSIDSAHSFANWELRHVVARTSGTFHDIKGSVVIDPSNIAKSSVNAVISVYSLNSSHLRRDLHTLTDEFLDARNYPEMKFVSTSVTPVSAEKGSLTGQLSLHGVTRLVSMDYQILGFGADPWGGMRAGFKAVTRINRADFGITKFTPTGPVGNEVDITLLIEGIKLGADGQPWHAKVVTEEKPKVISYPMPTPPAPQVTAVPAPQPAAAPVVVPPAAAAASTPAVTPVVPPAAPPATPPAAKDNVEDQLKKKLKGLFN